MLEVSHLTRCYGSFTAVDTISFSIGKGEIVGLLGHNGAGKTTIMKMLSGYLEPNTGSISIDGTDLATDPKTVQRGIGYLPENLPVYPEMTVADYLDYAAELKGLKDDRKRDEIRRAIRATEIGEKLLSTIATLSRGYKQRVGVAQAILGQPRLLILDEPTNGLDPTQTEHMRQLIRDVAKDATVMLSTHIMQEVDAVCDRVLILNNGRLAVDASLAELRQSNHLLLTTSMTSEALQAQLASLDDVTRTETLTGDDDRPAARYRYRLTLQPECDASATCATIARAVIGAGADLYQLQTEHRDLESLFRDVSNASAPLQQEVSDAA